MELITENEKTLLLEYLDGMELVSLAVIYDMSEQELQETLTEILKKLLVKLEN